MKILLDENLPRKLKNDLQKFEVRTVREQNWNGKKNGELLGLLTLNGFDIFITADRNIKHQQNLKRFPITIILLIAPNNKYKTLKLLIPKVLKSVKQIPQKQIIEIN